MNARLLAGGSVFAGVVAAAASFQHRPRSRRTEEPSAMHHRWSRGSGLGPEFSRSSVLEREAERRRRATLQYGYVATDEHPSSAALTLARIVGCGGAGLLAKLYFATSGTFQCSPAHTQALRDAVLARPAGMPLITVSNHTSVADDPVCFVPLPLWLSLTPSRLRVGICSEEICFKTRAHAALFCALQTLPIERGAGLEQPMLRALAAPLRRGEWLHVFPEGQTKQFETATTRLKWGVAKLICKSGGKLPLVVPLYHRGMERVYPQDRVTNKLLQPFPVPGQTVRLVVGEPVSGLEELIEEHRGRRIAARPELRGVTDEAVIEAALGAWDDTEADRALYSAIMARVQDALIALEEETRETKGDRLEVETRD